MQTVDEKKKMTQLISFLRGSDSVYKNTCKFYPPFEPKAVKTNAINDEILESLPFKAKEDELIALVKDKMSLIPPLSLNSFQKSGHNN